MELNIAKIAGVLCVLGLLTVDQYVGLMAQLIAGAVVLYAFSRLVFSTS